MSSNAEHSRPQHGGAAQLVQMANDIGNFFRAEPVREDAVVGIAHHIATFWTQRMRQKLAAHGEGGLDELPREALRRLADSGHPVMREPAGGDAG